MRNPRTSSALERMTVQIDDVLVQHQTWTGPLPESPAGIDDRVWRAAPASDVVRNSVISGAEHARLVLALLSSPESAPASVVYSTLRGVLVGASQALWIAACPEVDLRRARALSVTREDYRLRRDHHDGQRKSQDADRADHAATWVGRWNERLAALDAAARELPAVPRSRPTEMISWVGSDFFEDTSDARSTLLATWQICSAYAHALSWGNFLLPGARPLDPCATGPTAFVVELDWDHAVGEALMCAQLVLVAHRHLWVWSGLGDRTPGAVRL